MTSMEGKPPEMPDDAVRNTLDGSRHKPAKPQRQLWRGLALTAAALLALAVGAAYLWQWQHGVRGADLLRFVSIYLCIPMGVSLLLLFAALQRK